MKRVNQNDDRRIVKKSRYDSSNNEKNQKEKTPQDSESEGDSGSEDFDCSSVDSATKPKKLKYDEHFTMGSDKEGKKFGICKLCKTKIMRPGNNTTGLLRHLSRKHNVNNQITNAKQPKITDMTSKVRRKNIIRGLINFLFLIIYLFVIFLFFNVHK